MEITITMKQHQNNKNLVIALLTIAVILMATTHAVLADTPKANVKPLYSSKYTTFAWTDCSGVTRTGWFQPQLNTPPVTQTTFAWGWPASEKGSLFCSTITFDSVVHKIKDVTQNWTTDGQTYTQNQNTNGATFTLKVGGQTKTVQYNDSVQGIDWACYGNTGIFCNDTRQFTTSTWNAT